MAKRGPFNTTIRQKIILSLILNREMNPYRIAKEWNNADQQHHYRRNCRELEERGILNKLRERKVKGKTYIFYILNYKNFAKPLLDRIITWCEENKIHHIRPKFNKKDYYNLAEFCKNDIFIFFIHKNFINKDGTWNIDKNRFMVVEPFIRISSTALVMKTEKEAKRKELWIEQFSMIWRLSPTKADIKSFRVSSSGIFIYRFFKIMNRINLYPNKDKLRVYLETNDKSRIQKEGICLPPRNIWRKID